MASFCDLVNYKKRMASIRLSDDVIIAALETSAIKLRNLVFIYHKYETQQQNDEFVLNVPIADWDMSGTVDISDIEIFELTDEYVETDKSSKVTAFRDKYGYIKTDTDLPEDTDNKIVIEYHTAKYRNKDMKNVLIDLNVYLANDDLFNNIPFEKLQDGITEWTLNGVSVRFDSSSFNEIKKENQEKINKLLKYYIPVYSKTTDLGFGNDDDRDSFLNRYGTLRRV